MLINAFSLVLNCIHLMTISLSLNFCTVFDFTLWFDTVIVHFYVILINQNTIGSGNFRLNFFCLLIISVNFFVRLGHFFITLELSIFLIF